MSDNNELTIDADGVMHQYDNDKTIPVVVFSIVKEVNGRTGIGSWVHPVVFYKDFPTEAVIEDIRKLADQMEKSWKKEGL